MKGRRIAYAAVLLAALLFFVFYEGYLAFFLLVCILLTPFLSLALSLPALWGLDIQIVPPKEQWRGQPGQWQLQLTGCTPLPVSRLDLQMVQHNQWTGQEERQRKVIVGLVGKRRDALPLNTRHCGVVTIRFIRIRAEDHLGLFRFPMRPAAGASALILPVPAPPEELPAVDLCQFQPGTGTGAWPEGEDEELRDFRPGDSLRAVHWKLSSKWDRLLVRERQGRQPPPILLTFSCDPLPERTDRVLGLVWSMSVILSARGCSHEIWWMESGQTWSRETVLDHTDLVRCMDRLLSHPMPPATGRPELPPAVSSAVRIHLALEEEAEL